MLMIALVGAVFFGCDIFLVSGQEEECCVCQSKYVTRMGRTIFELNSRLNFLEKGWLAKD